MPKTKLLLSSLVCQAVITATLALPAAAQFGGNNNAGGGAPIGSERREDETRASLAELRQQVEALEARVKRGEGPIDARNLALWRFKIEQSRLFIEDLQKYNYGPWNNTERLTATLKQIAVIEKTRDDATFQPFAGTWERAYIARNDGSPQPYWVYLPADYTPAKKWPFAIMLHGYSPEITKIDPWVPTGGTMEVGTKRGFIVAIPYGRRNTDFILTGEDDTVDVLADMKKNYSIDEDRCFLFGPSMGGYGVYAIGLHRPDLWAGLAVMNGRTDTWAWLKLDPQNLPAWKKVLYQADDPRTLARNARNLPLLIQHGSADGIIPVEHSRLITDDLKKLGYEVRYREVPNGSHYLYWDTDVFEHAFDWMKPLRRVTAPPRVTFTTGSLRNNKAYWIEIAAFDDYAKTASVDAEVRGSEVRVTSENVASLTVKLPPSLAKPRMTLVVNGERAENLSPREALTWFSKLYKAQMAHRDRKSDVPALKNIPLGPIPYPGLKSPLRGGPVRDCYRDPFLLVYGDENDEAKARRFAEEWQRYADGLPPVKAAAEVTPADRTAYNLILFGTRASNSILGEIADRLPLELVKDGYRFGREQRMVWPDSPERQASPDPFNPQRRGQPHQLGLVFCYPSPFSEQRMVVVHSGEFWGGALPLNHKFDLQPDYLVFTSGIDRTDDTNEVLAAGFFDNRWMLDAKP